MAEGKLGAVESRFADIVWAHAPLASRELARLCEQELGWKRTTTYNVLSSNRFSPRAVSATPWPSGKRASASTVSALGSVSI